MKIKSYIKLKTRRYSFLYRIGVFYKSVYRYIYPIIGHSNSFNNNGILYKIEKDIIGNNNSVIIGNHSILRESFIRIHGNNNKIIIMDNCKIGKGSSFWIDGDDNKIIIRNKTTFTQFVHLCAQEKGTSIDIGEDCMLSNNIIIRTSDSHPIYSMGENCIRLNHAKSIRIGSHVWIAPKSTIMKGVTIGNGAIIGSESLVTKDVPDNVLVVGSPSVIVKKEIRWTREILF